MPIVNARAQLTECYRAAIAGAQPEEATRRAVAALSLDSAVPVWIIAFGKAAAAMTTGAVTALRERGREPVGGVVVAPPPILPVAPPAHFTLQMVAGDHPIPSTQSDAAARAIADTVARVQAGDQVLVLVSGGASSLTAAPIPELRDFTQSDLSVMFATLLASGADIVAMNAVRKRFTWWSGGRLALALARAHVHCLIVSDVLGDDLPSIGSGPCVPDAITGAELVATLRRSRLWENLSAKVRGYLESVADGKAPETPKASDPAFAAVQTTVIVSNAQAVAAAADCARQAGIDEVMVMPAPLSGEAAITGVRLASELISIKKRARGPWKTRCLVWGGETTVTLDGNAPPTEEGALSLTERPLGGRNQELALAAARSLYEAGEQARGITLLVAGTDGRDGPTDAAGAIVDGLTWYAIENAGRDPARDLATHNAHRALDAAHALLRTGLSGTNVMDIAVALIL